MSLKVTIGTNREPYVASCVNNT